MKFRFFQLLYFIVATGFIIANPSCVLNIISSIVCVCMVFAIEEDMIEFKELKENEYEV